MKYRIYFRFNSSQEWILAYGMNYTEPAARVKAEDCKSKAPLLHWGYGPSFLSVLEV